LNIYIHECDGQFQIAAFIETEGTFSLTLITMTTTNMSGDFLEQFEARAEIYLVSISNGAGAFLRNLDSDKHSEDEVRAMIDAFPPALSNRGHEDMLHIQVAVGYDLYVVFLPLLAEEGVKINVGGEGQRGGLLLDASNDNDADNTINVMQVLVNRGDDVLCLNVLKQLQELELL